MAVDDESFYNVLGEEVSREIIVNEMINFYSLLREIGDTNVTDFNEGSEIRNILEGVAVIGYWLLEYTDNSSRTAFVSTAEGELLDMHGANPWIKLPRDTGSESTGYVTFTIPEASSEDLVIAEGTTVVSSETGNDYYTENEIIIPAGETEAIASVVCAVEGTDGNAGTGEINIIEDEYLDIPELSVINEEPFTGGTDYEEDEEYRERLLNFIRRDDFGSLLYYQDLAENVTGVHDVVFVDDPDFTRKILVNGDVKPTPVPVLNDVLETFTLPNNIVMGHTFNVGLPDYVKINLSIDLSVEEILDETELTNIMNDLFNGGNSSLGFEFEGFGIGEALFVNSIVSTLETYPGVLSVTPNRIVSGQVVPLTDIIISENQCLQLESIVFNQTIEG